MMMMTMEHVTGIQKNKNSTTLMNFMVQLVSMNLSRVIDQIKFILPK